MSADPESARRSLRLRVFAIRTFFEVAFGLIGVFVLATMAAPALFNLHSNLSLIGAVIVWLLCPALLYLLASHVGGRWRHLNQGPRP